ncbi:hypothetical protein WSM22_32520 [Cytophagales bacterium WSM2-2]|nr:hypothetical protein WSM22_32520 [Cytophagales bacterium WSM2-2]
MRIKPRLGHYPDIKEFSGPVIHKKAERKSGEENRLNGMNRIEFGRNKFVGVLNLVGRCMYANAKPVRYFAIVISGIVLTGPPKQLRIRSQWQQHSQSNQAYLEAVYSELIPNVSG